VFVTSVYACGVCNLFFSWRWPCWRFAAAYPTVSSAVAAGFLLFWMARSRWRCVQFTPGFVHADWAEHVRISLLDPRSVIEQP
jgi:hypothetical protein